MDNNILLCNAGVSGGILGECMLGPLNVGVDEFESTSFVEIKFIRRSLLLAKKLII